MSSTLSFVLVVALTLSSLLFIMPSSDAQAESAGYYSNDLDDAIQAVESNNSMTHVGTRWYGRSTSRSFHFPPLLNTEMDQQVIEGAMGPTASGSASPAAAPEKETALGHTRTGAVAETLSEQRSSNSRVTPEVRAAELLLNMDVSSSPLNEQYGSTDIRGIRGNITQQSYRGTEPPRK